MKKKKVKELITGFGCTTTNINYLGFVLQKKSCSQDAGLKSVKQDPAA